jgi:hypothetical protein
MVGNSGLGPATYRFVVHVFAATGLTPRTFLNAQAAGARRNRLA